MRRTAKWLLALLAAILLVKVVGFTLEQALESERDYRPTAVDIMQERRQAFIRDEVRRGLLPPETLEMLEYDGTIDIDIQPPKGDENVIIDEDTGRPLQWDLDGSCEITRDERRITEYELYEATLGMVYDSGPNCQPPPERPA